MLTVAKGEREFGAVGDQAGKPELFAMGMCLGSINAIAIITKTGLPGLLDRGGVEEFVAPDQRRDTVVRRPVPLGHRQSKRLKRRRRGRERPMRNEQSARHVARFGDLLNGGMPE